ncbi:MAG: hypothetical protein ACI81L_000773 [Verrucomicrobiales bacterium]|jgi:hypothetical protein
MSDSTNDDPIYRGATPQDGVPWNPAAPPPPIDPPYSSPPPRGSSPVPPKKKRWPWIAGALVLFCGLPLGGCIALVGLGFNEINERGDAIESAASQYLAALQSGDLEVVQTIADDEAPCAPSEDLFGAFSAAGPPNEWDFSRTSFVDRGANSTFSSNADPETFVLPGRESESFALIGGTAQTESGPVDFELELTKPLASWRVCTAVFR